MRSAKKAEDRMTLPRVADLERSAEWTGLANDIDDLVKLRRPGRCSPAVTRRDPKIERHAYQRASMPEMQRACTVRFEDDNSSPLQRDEQSRWSWKPRTDFEREYFYKDYRDYYCGDPSRCPGSVSRESTSGNRFQKTRTPPTRRPEGLEKEHFSDSRERLHEIFEHNRLLRRQFFADMPGGTQQNRGGTQEAPKRCAGFGSTETLTSQSNQSSVSSINDRKSRAQATRTPEEEDEEMDTLAEFAGRNLSRVINRRNGGRTRRDGRVLVNILPGSEIRRADVRNLQSVKPDDASNESSPIAGQARYRDARETRDKSCQCRVGEDGINLDAWRDGNLPEYIFGGTSKIDCREEGWTLPNGSDGKNREDRLFRSQARSPMIRGRSDLISTGGNETNASESEDGSCWDQCRSLPNLAALKRCPDTPASVPRAVNVPEGLDSLGSTDRHEHSAVRSSHRQCREQQSGRREETVHQTRSINRGQSTTTTKSTTGGLASPSRLTSRREVKAARIPPPLDLSTVNERCELIEANERKYLSDYSVDVAILREDRGEGPAVGNERVRDNAISKDESPRNDRRERDSGRRRRKSSGPPCKSRNDVSPDELQSPQLVNDRGNDPVPIGILPTDPDARRRDQASSPLFDQTSSIGGPHAGGSALPSTVYGPIPYSQ
ncbi:hypothetical protein PUN28_005422 [Cardiocondyla obscurior]|uniref:Uncharacterized protein n=1 Tax=Cardiocondyla obscurior TaxID=286306 RepID=A0AAW2GJ64_9HYME